MEIDFFPIMGEALTKDNTVVLDFSPTNPALEFIDLSNTQSFNTYVFDQITEQNYTYGIGGYLENRAIYSRSEVFATAEADFRNIHLGIDIWAISGTSIFAPMDGIIHSFQDNAGFGNYGPTIILQHEYEREIFYSLYGHLSRADLEKLEIGQKVKAGEKFCEIGPYPENGDWPPHLHFQLMLDLMGNTGDFPGVCSVRELEKFKAICPNPTIVLRCEVL
ncbi:peptidoglycan DD-metalloendopeptidase family protein [Algoriphagus sp.]|uniref:peptidoglycan DD-metalloendopeptidase family protein n=1 Tax=Algoriphagus sp. TaxID=1872435 RepID=UPI003291D4AB